MAEPDLLEGGPPDAHGPRLPAAVWRVASFLVVVVGAIVLATSLRSSAPTPPAPAASPSSSVDDSAAAQADVEIGLSAAVQRAALIRDVPDSYRDAAGLASAMRGGRTPGNFFLAVAYERTRYGELLTGSEGERYAPRGAVQWEPARFRRYADPEHRDLTQVLDSFLAVDTALHDGRSADFSAGAYRPARLFGMSRREAHSVADIYEVLDGSGVREGLPN